MKSFSDLCFTIKISPNRNSPANHIKDTVTIHCYVGQVTLENALKGRLFQVGQDASANYIICTDGRIIGCVPETDRSWCSSNSANDNRAVTIECASDVTAPYAVNDKVMKSLINLLVDVCTRNKIKSLKWSDNPSDRVNHRNGCNMTVHRDFANKACPGEYLYSRMGDIAKKVNLRLKANNLNKITPYKVETIKDTKMYDSLGGNLVRTISKNHIINVKSVHVHNNELYGKGQKTGQYFKLKNTKII